MGFCASTPSTGQGSPSNIADCTLLALPFDVANVHPRAFLLIPECGDVLVIAPSGHKAIFPCKGRWLDARTPCDSPLNRPHRCNPK